MFHCEGLTATKENPRLYLATANIEFEPDDYVQPEDFVNDLVTDAQHGERHFCRLDARYTSLLHCVFVYSAGAEHDATAVSKRAFSLLSRLPRVPVELPPDLDIATPLNLDLSAGYHHPNTSSLDWSNMAVASSHATTIALFALIISQDSERSMPSLKNMRRLGDTTAGLLEIATSLQRAGTDVERAKACYVA
jgi:hypothetical protein